MSFFNLRRGGSSSKSQTGSATAVESIDIVRKRAKHRLIGAAVLVLVGVVGFPLLFDTQPRPVALDIPIEIPDQKAVKPLVMPKSVQAAAPPASQEAAAESGRAPGTAAQKDSGSKPEVLADKAPAAASKPADDSARAKSLLDGKAEDSDNSATTRLVVQVGAYADAGKAQEVRNKLEKAGLKTYAQVANTKDGPRTRVRMGPFANKAEADRAAAMIKSLGLPASILSL